MIKNHLATFINFLDLHSTKYKMLVLVDFKIRIDEPHMKSFCEAYNPTNLIKQRTCYKNPYNPICIDLILTNVPCTFQSTRVIDKGLSDFHLMTLTIIKKHLKNRGLESLIIGHLNIFPTKNLESLS